MNFGIHIQIANLFGQSGSENRRTIDSPSLNAANSKMILQAEEMFGGSIMHDLGQLLVAINSPSATVAKVVKLQKRI